MAIILGIETLLAVAFLESESQSAIDQLLPSFFSVWLHLQAIYAPSCIFAYNNFSMKKKTTKKWPPTQSANNFGEVLLIPVNVYQEALHKFFFVFLLHVDTWLQSQIQ